MRERRDIVALYKIALAVGSSLSLKRIIWTLYKEAGQLIDLSNFAVVIYDEETDSLNFYLAFERGKRIRPPVIKHSTNRGLISHIINNQSPLLVEDFSQTKYIFEINQFLGDNSTRSWLGIPFRNTISPDQYAQGALIIWSYKPEAFSHHDLWFLSEVGTQVGIAIRNAYLFEATQRRALEMAVMNDVAEVLSSTLELNELLHRIMDQVEGMLSVEAGYLLLKDAATGDLTFQIALGEQAHEVKPFRIPKGRGIAGRVAVTGEPVILRSRPKGQIDFNARNLLCVPLVSREQVIGVLEVLNKKEGTFSQQDLELLSAIASFAAIAIENARLHENVMDERDRVIIAEEKARIELARDLHDGPIQLAAGVVMRLNFCQMILDKEPALLSKELAQTMTLAEQSIQQMRTMLFELRPLVLETEGLESALKVFLERRQQELIQEQKTTLSLQIEADEPGGQLSRHDSKTEAAIFAIAQEAVNNAIKHAEASKIMIHLRETPVGLYLTISDDGCGFDVDQVMDNYAHQGSLGMMNVQERAEIIGGDLSIKSTPGQGTRLRVYIPKEQGERLKKRKTGMLSTASLGRTGPLPEF